MNIVIAAGGTGGHLYPAVALAREFLLQVPGSSVMFVGSGRGLEARVLAHERLELRVIKARPVMGVGLGRALLGVLWLPVGVWQSTRILREQRTTLVIGIGGYTSPAVVVAASLLCIPRVIVEPNAQPGMANRLLGPLAGLVFLAFESGASVFSAAKTRVVGSPVRRDFFEQGSEQPQSQGAARAVLLIFGGSQGASAINQAIINALSHLGHLKERLTVVHQTGEADLDRVQAAYRAGGFDALTVPFLYDLPQRLRAATLVVARSGAMTMAELTLCGKPAILIPLPQAIHDHQARNAQVLESAGAAVVLRQDGLSGERLANTIGELLGDPERLHRMGEHSRSISRSDAAERIVRECMELVRKKRGEA